MPRIHQLNTMMEGSCSLGGKKYVLRFIEFYDPGDGWNDPPDSCTYGHKYFIDGVEVSPETTTKFQDMIFRYLERNAVEVPEDYDGPY